MTPAAINSAAVASPEVLPELQLSPHPNQVTARGLAQLQARLADADARRAAVDGNDDEACFERDYLARHGRWLHARIDSAILVAAPEQAAQDRIGFGAGIELADGRKRRSRLRIVGEDEADAEQGLVSWVSPMARALDGARVGDSISWAGHKPVAVLRIYWPE
jgi:transcription elongation GreA/GreB family factor